MNIKVEDLMKKEVCFIKPGDLIGKVKRIFSHNSFNVLPVIKNGNLIGIISQSDILMVENNFAQAQAYMSTNVVTINPYRNIKEAAALMRYNHIHHLVVVNEKKMIGIISSYDLLSVIEEKKVKLKLVKTEEKAA